VFGIRYTGYRIPVNDYDSDYDCWGEMVMLGNHVVVSVVYDGTLAANKLFYWAVPFRCSLVEVSAVASNNSDATLKIGTAADDDSALTAAAIGDSGTPVVFDVDDFAGDGYPQFAAGTVVVLTLDFDGAAGTAAQNVNIVVTFGEG
jgi:hypothetical protein